MIDEEKIEIGKMADEIVQTFFKTPKFVPIFVEYKDHEKSKQLLETVVHRLTAEHPGTTFLFYDDAYYDEGGVFSRPGCSTTLHCVLIKTSDKVERVREEYLKQYVFNRGVSNSANIAPLVSTMCRCTGASTRLVDAYVSDFFDLKPGESISVKDHYPERRADEFLCNSICKRLANEYGAKFCRHGCKIVKKED